MSTSWLSIAEEVADALAEGRPVVALESTVITHGLPAPHNLEVAKDIEATIRTRGAVPATIGILDGTAIIGLDGGQLARMANAEPGHVRKCSRRDLPTVLARAAHGSTTVAATMMLAERAGIDVFATGGIGGVHRGHPFDVSADLDELGRTPVAVVCAGAKSILDIPLTLEALESRGVPVVAVGTDLMPAFYVRSSGLPAPAAAADAGEAAAILRAWREICPGNGLLFTVPIPDRAELPEAEADAAIAAATASADRAGITGAALTPYILARVAELTEGRSIAANRALLTNNAAVAAHMTVLAITDPSAAW